MIFWRERVRIELTRDTHVPHTGFEDREAHQHQSAPVNGRKASQLYHSRLLRVNLRQLLKGPGRRVRFLLCIKMREAEADRPL